MSCLLPTALLIAGLIHILPIAGVLGSAQLAGQYGVTIDDNDLFILMRHRAVLFALLGVLLIAAVFLPHLRILAIAAGLISAVSFLVLALSVGGYNAQFGRVVTADVIAIVSLLAAGILHAVIVDQ